MKTILVLVAALVAASSLAQSPPFIETALRASIKDPAIRFEIGHSVARLEDVAGLKGFGVNLWASAGSVLGEQGTSGGKLVGSFSALFSVRNFARGLALDTGPEYRSKEGQRPDWDWVFQIRLSIERPRALALAVGRSGGLGIIYSEQR